MPRTQIADQIERMLDKEQMWTFEGNRGRRNLEKIVKTVGNYRDIDSFLDDNPGAIEALVEWMGKQRCPEWIDNLNNAGYGEEPGEDDEEDGDGQ